jgi:hypothetical protein
MRDTICVWQLTNEGAYLTVLLMAANLNASSCCQLENSPCLRFRASPGRGYCVAGTGDGAHDDDIARDVGTEGGIVLRDEIMAGFGNGGG